MAVDPLNPSMMMVAAAATAHSSRSGERCKKAPMKGMAVCLAHGGAAGQVRAAARRRVVEQDAAAELAKLDVEPLDDPLTQLALLAAQAIAWKDMMAAKVNDLNSLRYEGTGSGEQLRAEVALWERALDRCEKFLVSMARLNIDERLAAVSEHQAQFIISFIVAALGKFGLDFHDKATHAIVMTLFDDMNDNDGRDYGPPVIEAPRKPGKTAVCDMDEHSRCRAYMPVEGLPVPEPWPARCTCTCHRPLRTACRRLQPGAART